MSELEETFLIQLKCEKLPLPVREYKFHPTRRWRFDFAWVEEKIAVEIEGAIWTKSRHTTGSGFIKDMDKYNQAALLGWTLIRFAGDHIKSGHAIDLMKDIFNQKKARS